MAEETVLILVSARARFVPEISMSENVGGRKTTREGLGFEVIEHYTSTVLARVSHSVTVKASKYEGIITKCTRF